jgi:hypothetical protein
MVILLQERTALTFNRSSGTPSLKAGRWFAHPDPPFLAVLDRLTDINSQFSGGAANVGSESSNNVWCGDVGLKRSSTHPLLASSASFGALCLFLV